jgi:DNA topoisomerase-1
MALYMSVDEEIESKSRQTKDDLPELDEGMVLKLNKLEPKQHFTLPPPRFSEASLVKELEENGIGRPSTYSAILTTIREKGYVDMVKNYFKPSELGFIVNDLLVQSFPEVFDVEFTAKMEDNLDRVEASEVNSLEILARFYDAFKNALETASKDMLSLKAVGMPTDLVCPNCNSILTIRVGKNGHFLGCSNYPECTYTRNYTRDEKGIIQPIEPSSDESSDRVCEKCGKPMLIKQGKYGTFYACSGYPDCKNTHSVVSDNGGQSTGVTCPEKDCGGTLVQRKSKRGKVFYGCSNFPDCTFAVWDKPVAKECPKCGAGFLLEKTTKKQGALVSCHTKGCGYKQKL